MQRRTNIQTSSSVTALSILTILVQFISYYYIDTAIIIWGISCFISALCCHLLIEQTLTYTVCFHYCVLTLFISLLVVILTYWGNPTVFFPYSNTMLGIALINWLIPMLHCFIRNMTGYGSITEDFINFYRNSSFIFLISYLTLILYGNFSVTAFPWAYKSISAASNFIPFNVITEQIEDFLYRVIPLYDILIYLASRVLLYVPYGFYISLVLNSKNRLVKCAFLLLLPFLVETLQFFLINERCDIDDLLYGFIGGLIGNLFFFVVNTIYYTFSGRDFLSGDKSSHYSGGYFRY